MQIIQGRGRNRKVIALPHGSIFAKAAKDEPDEYRRAVGAVADMTLGNPKCLSLSPRQMKRITARTARLERKEA